jgi:16S rRNA (guanine527-N7)-methyltransferase
LQRTWPARFEPDVSLEDVARVLADRAAHANLALSEPLASRLVVYFEVLAHWNRKINLTSLSDPDEAVDRLLLEPLAASGVLPGGHELIDLGSGGGSPAIPLALASRSPSLVMVESRIRKASFLREALREVGLVGTVESARFEAVAASADYARRFSLLSVRAVRLDVPALNSIAELLNTGGQAALFRTRDAEDTPNNLPAMLSWKTTRQLIPATRSVLTVLERST